MLLIPCEFSEQSNLLEIKKKFSHSKQNKILLRNKYLATFWDEKIMFLDMKQVKGSLFQPTGFLMLLTSLVWLATAAPTSHDQAEWRLISQTDDDEGEVGDVITLSDDVIIDAMFTNLDTLQDELEVCEEALRQKVIGIEDINDSEMTNNEFVSDPENILSRYTTGDGIFDIISNDTGIDTSNISTTTTTTTKTTNNKNNNNNNNNNINITSIRDIFNENNTDSDTDSNFTSTVRPSTDSSETREQTRVLDFHNDMVLFVEEVTDTTQYGTSPPSTQTNLGIDTTQQTPKEDTETDWKSNIHRSVVKIVHNEPNQMKPDQAVPTKEQDPGVKEQPLQQQRLMRPGRSLAPSSTAVILQKLSQRLEQLKRWVIDCHVMYKLFK